VQARDPSAVVKVRMRQDDRINLLCRDGRVLPVALAPFFLALKKSAVDQDLQVARVDKVLGAGDRARRAEELDIGHEVLYRKSRDDWRMGYRHIPLPRGF